MSSAFCRGSTSYPVAYKDWKTWLESHLEALQIPIDAPPYDNVLRMAPSSGSSLSLDLGRSDPNRGWMRFEPKMVLPKYVRVEVRITVQQFLEQ